MMAKLTLERLRALVADQVAPPPIPIPGYGQYVEQRNRPGVYDDSINPRKRFGRRPQLAPFKPGQTARTQRLKRRTRPTPGSVEGRRHPQIN